MSLNPLIRPYTTADKETVIRLLRLNTPAYFSPDEEKDLVYYLDHEIEFYFVVESGNQLVGCGGFNFSDNPGIGKISWDILHPEFQGKAIGTKLLQHRIAKLREFPELEKIIVRTSQLAYRFYEKSGFAVTETTKDYWAPGFDLVTMEYRGS
jgi:[ribosomal protein S18]-alanine N-acetyltransferase